MFLAEDPVEDDLNQQVKEKRANLNQNILNEEEKDTLAENIKNSLFKKRVSLYNF
jgi:hypothetical protein